MAADLLVTGIGELCRMGPGPGPQAGPAQRDVGAVSDAALAVAGGTIVAAGSRDGVLRAAGRPDRTLDVGGAVVLPGWVDAHTHLLFAGTREDEFAMRIQGRTYQEIAAAGGGSTPASVTSAKPRTRRSSTGPGGTWTWPWLSAPPPWR